MSTTEPIRDRQKLLDFKNYYLNERLNLRNYAIIILGLNTALRISDILNLTYDEVYLDSRVQEHITIREQKTGKENRILLNHETRTALARYRQELIKTEMYRNGNPFLFPSPKKARPDLAHAGVPHDHFRRGRGRHRGTHQLPFPAQDIRLPCVETRQRSGRDHGDL